MRKTLILLMVMCMAVFALNAVITYSSVTSRTVDKFASYMGTTTIAVADTANPYILSPIFTSGYNISNRSIMLTGTVTTAVLHTINVTTARLVPVLQVSADGVNFADFASYPAYTGLATVGTVITVPISLVSVYAPYYRIKWRGYDATGVALVADLFGVIRTTVITPATMASP